MAKFRVKLAIVEAIKWTGKNESDILQFGHGRVIIHYNDTPGSRRVVVSSPFGDLGVFVNDWIIRDERGEVYPCEPDIFKMKFEEVIE